MQTTKQDRKVDRKVKIQTKQDVIISFSATIKNVLDTSKATIPLEDSDIIRNCNNSVFTAREHIRYSLSKLDYHRRHKEVKELVDEACKVINSVNFLYLMPYGEYFRRWSDNQIQKELAQNENFLDDLYAIQTMEKKCRYYKDMVEEFNQVQNIYIDFSEKLQKNLNTLEPSVFELSKKKIDEPKKNSIDRVISSSCEELSNTSNESTTFVPTSLSKSKTRHLKISFPFVSAGVSRTVSSESLNSC